MSKQKKGMHKEYHTKRVNYELEFLISFIDMLFSTYDFERQFGAEVATAFRNLYDVLNNNRNGLSVQELVGSYVVDYGYNWVSNMD